ncbi:MAG: hypothetical protein KF901_19360 [Myxococcales bacterium]|nr:hypothetical protein [Myxococcales bacterium]
MTMTFTLENDSLRVGDVTLQFQRTLRIPDDGRRYPLPPGLGAFPLRRVDDYADRVPGDWRARGGVMLPMYQREAMWLSMRAPQWKPHAMKVAVGKVCALTGARWSEALHGASSAGDGQDYLVFPPQPWLDGICTGKGTIRQFVAMPLGMGYTVEGQVTGEEVFGGLQLKVVPPKPGRFAPPPPTTLRRREATGAFMMPCAAPAAAAPQKAAGALGLAAGGQMEQKIYPDPHGLDTWDVSAASRIFVHLVSSELWREITGEEPPATPVTAKTYAQHGLPWFSLYDEQAPTLAPTDALAKVKSVKTLDAEKSTHPLQDDAPITVGPVVKLPANGVRDGDW